MANDSPSGTFRPCDNEGMTASAESVPTATSYTTEQFLSAVHAAILPAHTAGSPATAVFDFDGTLWPGDAGSGFMQWTIQTGVLAPDAAERLLARHDAYHQGHVDETTICGEMVQIYAGIPEDAIRSAARQYYREHVMPHMYPEMLALVRELERHGVSIWAVSSTNNWVIEAGVRDLGIPLERVLAACVHSENGVITDALRDVPSGEGKAEALVRVGLPRPDAVFGNSVHDEAMLRIARAAFPVNPSAELQRISAAAGWPVYYPVDPRRDLATGARPGRG